MANPPGNHQEPAHHRHHHHPPSSPLGNGNSVMVAERWSAILKHNPGISSEWTAEEQAILEDGLQKWSLFPCRYSSDKTITRYAKIAVHLQNKTVRDVALRCRWMTKKENSKRRKEELSRKSKDKKERVIDPSVKRGHFAPRPSVLPYASTIIPAEYDDGFLYRVIGGPMGEILEKNAQAFSQISTNLANMQIQDNIGLLCQARDNILVLLNNLNNMPDTMRQMPALPVKVNEQLANAILPPPNIHMHPSNI